MIRESGYCLHLSAAQLDQLVISNLEQIEDPHTMASGFQGRFTSYGV
jgi:hypothetical protein